MSSLKKKSTNSRNNSRTTNGIYRGAYSLNSNFELYNELRALILKISDSELKMFSRRIVLSGDVRLSAVSGVFIDRPELKIDLLVIARKMSSKRFGNLVRGLEAEIGKELNYVLMSEEEFNYRKNMFDKFLKVFFENEHRRLVNKIGYLGYLDN